MIGLWIKAILDTAGIDIKHFTAYSIKHAAVSATHKKGVVIATIRDTAK